MVVLAAGSIDTGTNGTSSSTGPTSFTPVEKWYQGGTLHDKSALEWQTASRANKLATCADFVTAMWQNGNLKPSIANNISTVDDVQPYAQELVDFLDAAFKPHPDAKHNRVLFTNQTISECAAIGMIMMEWNLTPNDSKRLDALDRTWEEPDDKRQAEERAKPSNVEAARARAEEAARREAKAAKAALAEAEEEARREAAIEAAKWRTWTTASGKYQVEAKFLWCASDVVALEKKDGTTVKVKLDQLSHTDQAFVKDRGWRHAGNEQ